MGDLMVGGCLGHKDHKMIKLKILTVMRKKSHQSCYPGLQEIKPQCRNKEMNCNTCSWMTFMGKNTCSDLTGATAYPMDHDECPCVQQDLLTSSQSCLPVTHLAVYPLCHPPGSEQG